jgi:predicted Ser/Thr protein kinase
MTHRYNVFIREHQIVRFSIEVKAAHDVRAAIVEARQQYEQSGARWSAQAEIEIDKADIFAVDELDPRTGETANSLDLETLSASVDAPIDLTN